MATYFSKARQRENLRHQSLAMPTENETLKLSGGTSRTCYSMEPGGSQNTSTVDYCIKSSGQTSKEENQPLSKKYDGLWQVGAEHHALVREEKPVQS